MRMCQPHWDALRAAIEQRGDSRFIAQGGKAAVERLKRESEGAGPDDFDPLMSSMFAIFGNSTDLVSKHAGPEAALSFMAADICPLCELNTLHQRDCKEADCTVTYDDWIGRAADDAHAYIVEHITA